MYNRRINVRAIIWLDGKLLAVKHKASDGSMAPYFATPGGGLDPLESLQDGLIREIVEETGVTPRIGKLLFIQQFSSGRSEFDEELEFFFHVKNPEDFTSIDLANSTHGKHELALCEFIDLATTDYLLPQFLMSVDIARHIETDYPTPIFTEFKTSESSAANI